MELLAIRLSPQAGKSLVIRRRPESSVFNQLDTGLRRCDELLEVPLCVTLIEISQIRLARKRTKKLVISSR
jgi:hypothetical protein